MARWLYARPLVVDSILAVFVGMVAVALGLTAHETVDGTPIAVPDAFWEWPIIIGAAWMIPIRRLVPTTALVIGGLLQAVTWLFGFPDTFMAGAILIYSAAAYGGPRGFRASWITSLALTLFTLSGVLSGEVPLYVVPLVGLFSAAAASFGLGTANRQAYTEEVEARAVDLEESRKLDRDRALVGERARIARELHDVVAHGLSVIVVQASAAQRILDRDPAGTASALQQIEQTGRTALNEMRQVLGAIRTEPSESWQPAPGLGALDELIDEMRSTGLVVSVEEDIDREPLDPLPATLDLTAYRIIQESLTNVLKHGGKGARATVGVTRNASTLVLRIADNGRGAGASDSGGHGLRGMQERVEVFGGRFEAGPHPGGGFVVSVTLPVDGAGVFP